MQIYPSFLVITLLSLLAVSWYASRLLRNFYEKDKAADLEARARIVQRQLSGRLLFENEKELDNLCRDVGKKSSTRITVVLPSGRVIGDTDGDPAKMENHADRPEIIEALAGRTGVRKGPSGTLQKEMMYVAIPVHEDGKIVGAVRTSKHMTSVGEPLKAIRARIALVGLAIAAVAAVVSERVGKRQRRQEPHQRDVRHRQYVAIHEGHGVFSGAGKGRDAGGTRDCDGRTGGDCAPGELGQGFDH